MSHFSAPPGLPDDLADVLSVLVELPFAVLEPGLVAAALDSSPDAVADTLPRLADLGLLQAHPTTGLWEFPNERRVSPLPARPPDPGAQLDRLQRAVAWWLASLVAAERQLAPWHRPVAIAPRWGHGPAQPLTFDSSEHARAWVVAQAGNVIAVIAGAALRWDHIAWRATLAASRTLWRVRPDPGVQLLCSNWAVGAVKDGGSRQEIRAVLLARSGAARQVGQYSDACDDADAVLYFAEEDGDKRHRGDARHAMGSALLAAGRAEPARERFTEALAVREEVGDERAVALTRLLIGLCHREAGDPRRALAELDVARGLLARVGDQFDQARALAYTARVRADLGAPVEAVADLKKAATLFAGVRADPWWARCVTWLATSHPDAVHERAWHLLTEAVQAFGDNYHVDQTAALAALAAHAKRRRP
ncbi:tetratricopeptide repeat protein [Kitasatospora sp. NPDC096147]|uniref:tetratricopeptide repeat protein n=1 Tax=Kitasatospora sp. NPDC096147 TaxID=3364093 RepID=UPI00382DAC2A